MVMEDYDCNAQSEVAGMDHKECNSRMVMKNCIWNAYSEVVDRDQKKCSRTYMQLYLAALWPWKTIVVSHIQKWLA